MGLNREKRKPRKSQCQVIRLLPLILKLLNLRKTAIWWLLMWLSCPRRKIKVSVIVRTPSDEIRFYQYFKWKIQPSRVSTTLSLICFKGYSVTVRMHDIVLEEDMAHIKKENLGFYIFLGPNLLDVLMLPKKGPTNPVKIPLSTLISTDMIKIVAKTLGVDEIIVGSVSIPQYIILNGGLASYTQWITLFEH